MPIYLIFGRLRLGLAGRLGVLKRLKTLQACRAELVRHVGYYVLRINSKVPKKLTPSVDISKCSEFVHEVWENMKAIKIKAISQMNSILETSL